MDGIVSVLAEPHYAQVKQIWAGLNAEFGVRNPNATFVPHFSYHVAEGYDEETLPELLQRLASETAVFPVQATGIGIFPGEKPVLYIPIARSPRLNDLHKALWTAVDAVARGSLAYYHPSNWFAHITLAHGDITEENLGPIVNWLTAQNIAWTLQVDTLALIGEESQGHALRHHARLTQPG